MDSPGLRHAPSTLSKFTKELWCNLPVGACKGKSRVRHGAVTVCPTPPRHRQNPRLAAQGGFRIAVNATSHLGRSAGGSQATDRRCARRAASSSPEPKRRSARRCQIMAISRAACRNPGAISRARQAFDRRRTPVLSAQQRAQAQCIRLVRTTAQNSVDRKPVRRHGCLTGCTR